MATTEQTKKVIFIGPVPPPYMGPTVATEILLKSGLAKQFKLIHLDTSDHRGAEELGAIDFTNIYLGFKHTVQLLWLILVHKPAMVYIPISQTTMGYLRDSMFIAIAALLRRTILCHLRGGNFRNWFESCNFLMQRYVRLIHGFVDGQIVLGKKLIPLFEGLLPANRIFVVPNGRDFPPFSIKHSAGPKITILYLANFIRTKGIIDVVHAAPIVAQQCPHVEFVLAGNWVENDVKLELEAFLQRGSGPVRIIGPVVGEKKNETLRSADIFVFPSYYPPEGHPWVIVEAMAAGLPIISTDQGAITESVIDGENGYIVEKHNPAALAAKIIELIRHPEKRLAMGQASRKLYEENFTEAIVVSRMAQTFNVLLGSDRSA